MVLLKWGTLTIFLKKKKTKLFCKQKWLMCPINLQNPQQNDS